MPFGNYFAIIAIVLAIGQISHVACGDEEPYEYFREGFDREGFQDSLSDDEAVKLHLVRSEEGVVVGPEDYLFYKEEEDGERRRARRSVDQTQRDAIVQTLNDIRRSVNSSDIQYMYWNSADEPMLSTWASGCQYSAKVYLSATARILKMVTEKPPDFVAQLYESFGFPELQKLLTSAYIIKMSANSYFCPKLVTNSTTTFNNSYLGIISLTYVTGFKVNATQFTVGPPCTTCLSGVYWCDDKLCRADCSPAIPTCYCRPACLNCAGYNETTCKCKCLSGWGGARCEYNTTLTPTVPNCTTIAPSTYPSTSSYISTVTTPITPDYFYLSNSTALSTATAETQPSTMTSYLNESVTTENATIDTANDTIGGVNETTASFFNENMTTVQSTNETTNETTPSFPIGSFNETTTSFFNENMTTVQSTNETTNETTPSFPIGSFNETTTSFFNENMTTVQSTNETTNETTPSFPIGDLNETITSLFNENLTTTVQSTNETTNNTTPVFPLNETTSTLLNVTEQSTFTTAPSTNNILNTSAPTVPIQSTTVNNLYDFSNYTQRLLDIEKLLLRLFMMFQYYLTTTTTVTATASTGTSSVSGNDSSGITPLPAINLSSVVPAATAQANNSAVDTGNSTYTSPVLASSASQTQTNEAGTSTITPLSTTTTKPPFDLWNYLNSLDDIKKMILQILMTLEMRLTTTTPSQNSPSTAAGIDATAAATAQANNSTSSVNNNNNNNNNNLTASTNPLTISNVSVTDSNVPNVSGANTFPSTSSPPFTLPNPYDPLWLSLMEILRRLEMFLQTSSTPTQNVGSTVPGPASQGNSSANPLTSLAPPPYGYNNTSTSTALRDETNNSTPKDNNNSANSSTNSTLNNSTATSNPANSSSSSDGRSFTPPFFGSNSNSGASTATTATPKAGNTASNLNNDLYQNQLMQLLFNLLAVLDNRLRNTTPDKNRPTTSAPQFPNSSNVSNTTTASITPNVAGNATGSSSDSNASTPVVYRGNTSDANGFTASPAATGPPLPPFGSATTTQAGPKYPIREFLIRIWDYRTSTAATQSCSFPKNLMSIVLLLMGTILQLT